MYNYYCIISKEEDFYIVDFPDFKGSRCSCFTFGETLTEAVEMAEDVLVTMLDGETSVPTRSSLKAILSHAKEGDSILNVTVNINDIS